MIWLAVGLAVGVVSGVMNANAQARQQEAAIRARREAAKLQYTTTEASINIMKEVNREQTLNAVVETQRAGAENIRETEAKVEQTASKLNAQSEGLTSGRTAGRQMTSLYIQGNKKLQETQDVTTSQINKIVEIQDQKTNELNNNLMKAYQDLTATLLDEGPSINKTNEVIMGGLKGALAGASLGNSFGGAAGASTSSATGGVLEGPLLENGQYFSGI